MGEEPLELRDREREHSFETAEGRKIGASLITVGKTIGAALLIVLGLAAQATCPPRGTVDWRLLGQSPGVCRASPSGGRGVAAGSTGGREPHLRADPVDGVRVRGRRIGDRPGLRGTEPPRTSISGVMLLIEAPRRVGDLIEFGGMRGRVTDICFRASSCVPANEVRDAHSQFEQIRSKQPDQSLPTRPQKCASRSFQRRKQMALLATVGQLLIALRKGTRGCAEPGARRVLLRFRR